MTRDSWRHRYIEKAKACVRAGFTTNAEIGKVCGGVSAGTVKGWRLKYRLFDKAITTALIDLGVECTERALEFSRAGDVGATFKILERRIPAWKPKTEHEVGMNKPTLQALLASRMQESEAWDRGLLIEAPAEECEEEYVRELGDD